MALRAAINDVGTSVKPKRRKTKLATTTPVTLVRWHVMLLLALTFAVAASGLSLVRAAQQMRSLHSALDVLQSAQDRQMAEYSRLLLERSTFASLQTVEVVAIEELQMKFPLEVEGVVQDRKSVV